MRLPFLTKTSLLLLLIASNLLLGLAVVFLWSPSGDLTPKVAYQIPPASQRAVEAGQKEPGSRAVPAFHWSQLDAPDFPTYVANLRAIGCPEATIRDIVSGELREIYAIKRKELSASSLSMQQSFDEEQAQVLESVMAKGLPEIRQSVDHQQPDSTLVASAKTAPPADPMVEPAEVQGNPTPAMLVPVAFQLDGSGSPLVVQNDGVKVLAASTPSTATPVPGSPEAIKGQLRDIFTDEVASANLPASDPNYERVWKRAQGNNDDRLSSLIGGDAFVAQQIKAAQAAYAESRAQR